MRLLGISERLRKRSAMTMPTNVEVLRMIVQDCEADVNEYEGKAFTGRNVA